MGRCKRDETRCDIEIATLRAELDEAKAALRDQFAMAALTGLLTSPEILGCTPKKTASDAYAMADAMIEARALRDAKGEG